MRRAWEQFERLVRLAERILEGAVVVAVAVLVLVVLWGVAARYCLSDPSRWTEEAARLLLMWVAMLGAAVAYSRGEHLGFDYVASRLDPGAGRALGVVVELTVIAFAAAAMVYGGYVLTAETLGTGQLTPALQLPMGYVYLAAPISGVFFVLFGLVKIRQRLMPDAADPAP
ncbi:MAG: TRAP transporter small permease [Pirellulales bacterium]|nr:TRAP transporter small permease [Pirellulales bacterium]MBX3434529.1 TRAP transporter small permease [Pirellulales bacterium]